jgi:predicted PurR-regulated permease PerM
MTSDPGEEPMDELFQVEIPTNESESLEAPEAASRIPTDEAQLIVQICLLIIAVFAVAYVAAEIVLPIILAFVLKLLFQPVMRVAARLHIPNALAAIVVIVAVFATIVALGAAFSGPAATWAQKLPEGFGQIKERLHFLSQPVQTLQAFLRQFDTDGATGGASTSASIETTLLRGTQYFASGFFETLIVLFFLLLSGDTFLRRLVEIVPTFKDKRRIVSLSQQIEDNISSYLVTVTLMNVAVGIATALAMWACGLEDPLLWGGIAFLLNYVPIIGPFGGVALFTLAGLLTFDNLWRALLPPGLYLLIHIVEGEAVTPMLLARRFTLNPVLVVISLIFWFWMWGTPGAVLAVPMLAVTKIICDGVKPLAAIGHFLEG